MKKKWSMAAGAAVLAYAVGGLSPVVAASDGKLQAIEKAGVFKVGVLTNEHPFSSKKITSDGFEGFDVDIAQYVAQEIVNDKPIEIEYVGVTKATRVPLLQGGDIDMLVATLSITDERKKVIDFSIPYYPAPIGIMVPKDSDLKTLDDLANKTNCNPQGSAAWMFFQEGMKNVGKHEVLETIDVVQLPSPTDCLLALRQKRDVDFIAGDYATMLGQITNAPELVMMDDTVGEELNQFGIAIAQGNDDLVAEVNKAICKSFSDGAWEESFSKWFVGGKPPQGWPQQCNN